MPAISVRSSARSRWSPAARRDSETCGTRPGSTGRLHHISEVTMTSLRMLAASLVLACGVQLTQFAYAAPHAVVTRLMQKDVAEMPGKELLMVSVEYPPGSVDPVH